MDRSELIQAALEELEDWKADEVLSKHDSSIRRDVLNRRFMAICKAYPHDVFTEAMSLLAEKDSYDSWLSDWTD